MKSKMSLLAAVFAATLFSGNASAQTVLFESDSTETCYRIPAIVNAKDGSVFAYSDYRPCRTDVGGGVIDVVAKRSKDNGKTWSEEHTVVKGGGQNVPFDVAHGDAAVVTDRKTGEMMMMCASGNVWYWQSTLDNPNRVGRYYSKDGMNWEGEEITDQIYKLMNGAVHKLFFTSGRICQSSKVKAGKYYRIYSALCTNVGNVVLYSDDFGRNWQPLGGAEARPALYGDEAKIVELPNGDLLLCSRYQRGEGRIFNIFKYDNAKKAEGKWQESVMLDKQYKAAMCNGEVLMVKAVRKSDGKSTNVLLFSVPMDSKRNYVGIYYKELASTADYASPACFQSGWKAFRVSNTDSAYSTMEQMRNKHIAFFYEESEIKGGYNMMFRDYTLGEITGGEFEAK